MDSRSRAGGQGRRPSGEPRGNRATRLVAREMMRERVRHGFGRRKRRNTRGEVSAIRIDRDPGRDRINPGADAEAAHSSENTIQAVGARAPLGEGSDTDAGIERTDQASRPGDFPVDNPAELTLEGTHLLEINVVSLPKFPTRVTMQSRDRNKASLSSVGLRMRQSSQRTCLSPPQSSPPFSHRPACCR